MNSEFIKKMREAKKLESEAFKSFLPENVRGHIEVIENEIKAILFDCIAECSVNKSSQTDNGSTVKSNVHKVDIG